jgi:transposase-like protein
MLQEVEGESIWALTKTRRSKGPSLANSFAGIKSNLHIILDATWQNRPLDSVYLIVFLDCIVVKSREEGRVCNRSVYLALGVNMDGQKELLGIWIAQSEGAKFWLGVITELHNRGVKDIFIACVDGLKGFPEAIESVFPQTQIQLCIIHMIRNSVKYFNWKDRKALCFDLKYI